MSNIKDLIRLINRSPEYEKLFWILYESKDGITAKDLINDYGFNKRVYERLKKFENSGITKDISTHNETFKYILTLDFSYKTINHLRFFEKIQQNEERVLFGDVGELSHRNPFARRFMNNHTLLGFSKVFNEETDEINYTDLEIDILDGLLQQIDDAFESLKTLKLVYEARKKIENENWLSKYKFPYGMISEQLILKNIVFWFSKVLNELLEQDLHHQGSHKFIYDLCQETMKLAKKHKLWLSDGAYPEKSFTWNNPFIFELLIASNPEIAVKIWDKNGKNLPPSKKSFDLIKNENWIFNKNGIISLEKLEEKIIKDAEKQLIKGTNLDIYNKIAISKVMEKYSPLQPLYEHETGKKFYPGDLDIKESIALLSTQSILESTVYERDIELRLDYFFSGWFLGDNMKDYKSIKHNSLKVSDMTTLVYSIIKSRDKLTLEKFKRHNKINDFFRKNEIELLIYVTKEMGKLWINRNECEYLILVKLYEKDGAWYTKYFYEWAKEIINKNLSGKDELLKEIDKYCKRLPLKDKGAVFEGYVKARYYFEKIKPVLDKEREEKEKSKKFKYKIEVRDFKDLFQD